MRAGLCRGTGRRDVDPRSEWVSYSGMGISPIGGYRRDGRAAMLTQGRNRDHFEIY